MNKSILSICATATLMLTALTGCGGSPASPAGNSAGNTAGMTNTTGSTKPAASADKVSAVDITPTVDSNATPAAGEIVIGVDDTYPPMEFMNADNRLVGFDIDFGDELGKYIGKKVVWKPTAWDGIIAGLNAKKYDGIISSMNITPERQKQIQFVEYTSFGQVIIQPSNAKESVSTLSDLKGKTVGVQLGTTSEDAVKKEGGITIKEYNTFPDAFQDLSAGRIAAAVVDQPVGLYYVAKQPDNYHVAGSAFDSEPVGIGLRKDENDLAGQIQEALTKMKQDGTYDKIYEYWFGTKSSN
jgi:ABC-type amino acid transport substrate-binding protein